MVLVIVRATAQFAGKTEFTHPHALPALGGRDCQLRDAPLTCEMRGQLLNRDFSAAIGISRSCH